MSGNQEVRQATGALCGPADLHGHLDIEHSDFQSVVGVLLMAGKLSSFGRRHCLGIERVSLNSTLKE